MIPARALAAVALALAVGAAPFPGRAGPLKAGDVLPDPGQFGLEGRLPDWRGRIVLVDFWASWCGPCKQSFPAMNELHRKYGARGLVIIAVNVDEQPRNLEKFLKQTPADFAVIRDAKQRLVSALGVQTMPTSFLIDGSGKVRHIHSGYAGEETKRQYIREIEALLASTAEAAGPP